MYWPSDVRDEDTLEAFFDLFEKKGYARCEDASREVGFEKVAIFASGRLFEHAAKMTSDGEWISKLGDGEDIQHETPEVLEGKKYGQVVAVFKKKI
jgi:hypothetical protein